MKLKNLLSAASLGIAMMVAALPGTARAQDSNVLNVATDATFPPMEFVDKGERTGFDIDIMNALAKVMGKKIQWTDIDFKGLIPRLDAHRFDAAISGIYITPERVQVVDFTRSYFAGGPLRACQSGFADQDARRSQRQESDGAGRHEVGELPAR